MNTWDWKENLTSSHNKFFEPLALQEDNSQESSSQGLTNSPPSTSPPPTDTIDDEIMFQILHQRSFVLCNRFLIHMMLHFQPLSRNILKRQVNKKYR